MAYDRDKWPAFLYEIIKYRVPKNAGGGVVVVVID